MYLHMNTHDVTKSKKATSAVVNPDKITLSSNKHNLDDLLLFT